MDSLLLFSGRSLARVKIARFYGLTQLNSKWRENTDQEEDPETLL